MSLPESLRQEYLQSLGIDSYFPRRILPGAPASVQCEWPAPGQELVNAMPEQPAPESARKQPPEPLAPLLKDRVEKAPPGQAKKPTSTRAPALEKQAEKQATKRVKDDFRLQLICIRVNNGLAIINAMPHLGPRQLPNPHSGLLKNILRLSAIEHENLQVEEKPFHWPMVQGAQVDNSRSAAAAALTAYVEQKFTDWQFHTLLVMGEQAVSEVFTPEDESMDGSKDYKDKQELPLDNYPWQTHYTRSLDEFLQSPGLKKELWAVIRKLHA